MRRRPERWWVLPPFEASAVGDGILGDQRPRLLHLPSSVQRMLQDEPGRVGTLGREAVALARHAGLNLDPWQEWLLEMSCATTDETYWNPLTGRYEHKWAAFEVGICIPRQNGKGGFLQARELAGLFLWGEKEIIHSAHEFGTSRKHFERLLRLIENTPDLEAEVLRAPKG